MANENNKIPCGGFYLGDGLTMDGNTLKSSGGKQVQTDWNQNDESAADYVKNRPGGYTKTTPGYEITWDGVVGDKVVVDGGEMQFVKVSDRVFTAEELIGATMVFGDTSLIVRNDTIINQNGIIINEGFLVCSAPTTMEGITFTETGTYFMKTGEGFASSLSKPDSTTTIKIPAELTTVVGGYDREARTDALFNGVVKPSDFVDAKTLQTGGGGPSKAPKRASSSQPTTQYCALITLATSLIDGSTVTGTVNGVGVHGEISGNLILYNVDGNKVLIIGAIGNMTACSLPDYSIPSSDLVISLTQSVQASPVVIPKEYLDLGIVNEHISYAQMTAETAYQKADTAQSTANTAKATADTAKATADTAKTTAEAIAERYKDTQAKIGDTTIRPSYILLDIGSENESSPARIVLHSDRGGAPKTCTTIKAQSVTADRRDRPAQLNLTGETVYAGDKSSLDTVEVTGLSSVIIASATSGSTKKFRITVDDTGAIKATEVTNN